LVLQENIVLSTMADIDRLRSPKEALETILAHTPVLPRERVALHQAAWRVLAEDLIAPEDHPPFPAATMDGFAVIADDSSPWREIIAEQMAGGVVTQQVTPGTAIRITTGAAVPSGADAVIPVEQTELVEDHVIIHDITLNSGDNIRPIGADLRQGDHLLPAGTLLGPAELGLVAGAGLVPVPVRRRPRVSVISTGDELVEPGEHVRAGQIRDSNRFSLIAALEAERADVRWAGHAPDVRDPLRALLLDRMADSDLVITSGGVSMGELDLVKALLVELANVHFRRVFMKPGKPFTFATAGESDKVLFFGLPGNPVSALAGFELFVRPALATMADRAGWERPRVPVALSHTVQPSDRIEYQRAIVRVHSDGHLIGSTTGSQGSSRLVSWIGANALLIIPPRDNAYAEGERVEALLLGAPLGPK
jgi:gephyrin